ncbi:MAG: exopolysaccharide biosynthesis protein [Alphaproteobacteria bacterium]|nr:exopolysaccharide biosynthesis protein [Alphaproteobacteria bacterium]
MAIDAASHTPTSVVIEELLRQAPADFVTLEWLIGTLRERSFGLVMLVMALVALVPGASTFVGVLLAYPAIQMILARPGPTLPAFIAERQVSTARVAAMFGRAAGVLKWLERFIRPRWPTPFEATKRVVGVVVLLLAPTLIWPFPFGHVIPSLVIGLLSLAYLEEDGVLLCIGLAAAVLSLAITGLTVWAGIRVVDWL